MYFEQVVSSSTRKLMDLLRSLEIKVQHSEENRFDKKTRDPAQTITIVTWHARQIALLGSDYAFAPLGLK